MKSRAISAVVAILFFPAVANAQVTINMAALTCNQYLAMSPQVSRDFSAWISGWFSNRAEKRSVDLLQHRKNVEALKTWCLSHPEASVMSAAQTALGPQ